MITSVDDFKASLTNDNPPTGLTVHLISLWYDGRGDWKTAHDLVDQLGDKRSAHLHAYLHRKEGDLWNADYWYSRAGERRPAVSLEQEWADLVQLFIKLQN